jgi:hypothetical protein
MTCMRELLERREILARVVWFRDSGNLFSLVVVNPVGNRRENVVWWGKWRLICQKAGRKERSAAFSFPHTKPSTIVKLSFRDVNTFVWQHKSRRVRPDTH